MYERVVSNKIIYHWRTEPIDFLEVFMIRCKDMHVIFSLNYRTNPRKRFEYPTRLQLDRILQRNGAARLSRVPSNTAFVSDALFGCLRVRSVSKTRRCLPNPSLAHFRHAETNTQTKGVAAALHRKKKVKDCFVFRSLSPQNVDSLNARALLETSAEFSLPGAPPKFEQIRVSPKGKSRLFGDASVRAAHVRFGGSPVVPSDNGPCSDQWLRTGPLLYENNSQYLCVWTTFRCAREREKAKLGRNNVPSRWNGGQKERGLGSGNKKGKGLGSGKPSFCTTTKEKAQKFRVQYW